MVLQEDERALRKVMELACGCKGGVSVRDVQEMVVLGAVADQYGMEAVVSAVEDAIVRIVNKGKARERRAGDDMAGRGSCSAWDGGGGLCGGGCDCEECFRADVRGGAVPEQRGAASSRSDCCSEGGAVQV